MTMAILYIELSCFVLVLLFTLWNTYGFLYKQKRYSVVLISSFYIFAYGVLLSRVLSSCFAIHLALNGVRYAGE